MTIKNLPQYQILANVLQTTFGKTSQKSVTHFLNMSLTLENRISVRYQSIVNFGHQNVFLELKNRYKEEGIATIEKSLEKLAEEYKKQAEKSLHDGVKKTLKFKLIDSSISESIEYVSRSLYNPNQTAFFRVNAIVEVE